MARLLAGTSNTPDIASIASRPRMSVVAQNKIHVKALLRMLKEARFLDVDVVSLAEAEFSFTDSQRSDLKHNLSLQTNNHVGVQLTLSRPVCVGRAQPCVVLDSREGAAVAGRSSRKRVQSSCAFSARSDQMRRGSLADAMDCVERDVCEERRNRKGTTRRDTARVMQLVAASPHEPSHASRPSTVRQNVRQSLPLCKGEGTCAPE